MAPASYRQADGKARGVTRSLLDVNPHHGERTVEPARANVDVVETLFDDLFEFRTARIAVA